MIIENIGVILDEIETTAKIMRFETSDREQLYNLYNLWVNLNRELVDFGATRKINIPELITEGAFCICSNQNFVRVLKVSRGSSSFDVLNLDNFTKIQVKATSSENELTSFSPNSNWDEFYFLDFHRDGEFNGLFDVYMIPSDLIFNRIVNQRDNKTFRDVQNEGKRPRFKITNLIRENDIQRVMTCNLNPNSNV